MHPEPHTDLDNFDTAQHNLRNSAKGSNDAYDVTDSLTQRTFQYAGESLKTAETVTTSLPQGDPWSMIAMAAALLIPFV